ncbi:class I SAM-dependent methyltransferase [Nocardiopsis coralliicola]
MTGGRHSAAPGERAGGRGSAEPDPAARFTGLASGYARYRPDYPAEAMERLRAAVADGGGGRAAPLLVDVGCGTGVSTRALRAAFGPEPRIAGVEPNADMRAQGLASAAEPGARPGEGVRYVAGRAEQLPFGAGTASLVLAAQALHWFDRPVFYREAVRVLAPGGVAAVLSNDRQLHESALLDAYESFLEAYAEGYRRDFRSYDAAGELGAVPGVGAVAEFRVPWTRHLDRDGFLGLAFSSSRTADAVRAIGREAVRSGIAALLNCHHPDGRVPMPMATRLVIARKEGGAKD